MLHIPILRGGQPYESVEKTTILHHATGAPVACVSLANSGLIRRDVKNLADDVLERFTTSALLKRCRKAADLFMSASLPVGDTQQTFDDYVNQLSATTGMPVTYCRNNASKIQRVLQDMEAVLGGLTRGLDLNLKDCEGATSIHGGNGAQAASQGSGASGSDGASVHFYRAGRVFGAVLPSNSPGVHSLWLPAVALKTPIVLKPGREEPWTPLRIIEALAAAGLPREAMGFYPTDHAGAAELLRSVDRAMVFGDASTTKPWHSDARVEVHGPGFSKILLGNDTADDWQRHLDVIVSSIQANGGRSCINASAVWTPRHGRRIAEAIAERLANVTALPADDPQASIAAFANPAVAEWISGAIDQGLAENGAVDVTQAVRGTPRLVTIDRCAYLLPTVVWCQDRAHPLANREFLFPYASVVECPVADMPEAIGPSLVVTAITADESFTRRLMNSPNVDRLNIGPIPTWSIRWDQPHEGNLFEHLYRRRAFQIEPAA